MQGNCTEKQPRWYYDTPQKRCMPFYYSGCNGNRNNFIGKEACETDCPKEIRKYFKLFLNRFRCYFLWILIQPNPEQRKTSVNYQPNLESVAITPPDGISTCCKGTVSNFIMVVVVVIPTTFTLGKSACRGVKPLLLLHHPQRSILQYSNPKRSKSTPPQHVRASFIYYLYLT